MAQVLIRGLEPETITKLKSIAQTNNRSLEAELRMICERAVESMPVSRRQSVEQIRALLHGQKFSDSSDMVREDRDR